VQTTLTIIHPLLNFDAYNPFKLQSVKVYAKNSGNRTIYLGNSSGTVIQSLIINIPAGKSRVNLNFDQGAGGNLDPILGFEPSLGQMFTILDHSLRLDLGRPTTRLHKPLFCCPLYYHSLPYLK
jgi:hypothetical protein